jgi:hypothetical protein
MQPLIFREILKTTFHGTDKFIFLQYMAISR